VVVHHAEDPEGPVVDLVDGQVAAEVSQRFVQVGARQRGPDFLALPLLSANVGRKEPLDLENPGVSHLKAEEPFFSMVRQTARIP